MSAPITLIGTPGVHTFAHGTLTSTGTVPGSYVIRVTASSGLTVPAAYGGR